MPTVRIALRLLFTACAFALVAHAAFGQPQPTPFPSPGEPAPATTSTPEQPAPAPSSAPTQPPIIVEPPGAAIAPGHWQLLRVNGVLGQIAATLADPSIADFTIDQVARTVTVIGRTLGTTTLTVTDQRGVSQSVTIRVALLAGEIPPALRLRVTGNPASTSFLQSVAARAAAAAVRAQPHATIVAPPEVVHVPAPLPIDSITTVDIPIIVQGPEYITSTGTMHVRIENFAEPRLPPSFLMVSDYPETLSENGILFNADLAAHQSARFLYYHYNPPAQPARRIVLKIQNDGTAASTIQYISGVAGPGQYEMEVGHLSTERFLTHLFQDEGTIVEIPPRSTITLVDQLLPPGMVVSHLMELRELEGVPLHLALVAQNASDPVDGASTAGPLLGGGALHARGVYPIPEFFFDYQYETGSPDLELAIGQIPLPNIVEGQALAGDYGVLQQISLRIINTNQRYPAQIALYASPRGGRATGTFIIDGVLVRAHAMPPFARYKLREYTVPPGGFIRTTVTTMPEGGSSYPVRLIVAPDDGSTSPGAPNSYIY